MNYVYFTDGTMFTLKSKQRKKSQLQCFPLLLFKLFNLIWALKFGTYYKWHFCSQSDMNFGSYLKSWPSCLAVRFRVLTLKVWTSSWPAAAASPGNLLEIQILRATPQPYRSEVRRVGSSNLYFNSPPRDFKAG